MGRRMIRRYSSWYCSSDPVDDRIPIFRGDGSGKITDPTEYHATYVKQLLLGVVANEPPRLEQDVVYELRLHQVKKIEGIYMITGILVIEEPGNETSTSTTS